MFKGKQILLGTMIAAAIVAIACIAIAPVLAVTTSHFVSGNKTDFSAGKLRNVVVTSLGDVKLSRAVDVIKLDDADVTVVNALAESPDGVIYAGTSPKGILLAVKDGKSSTLAKLEDTVSILSLKVLDKGDLLIGTGGDKGKLLASTSPAINRTKFSARIRLHIRLGHRATTTDGNVISPPARRSRL